MPGPIQLLLLPNKPPKCSGVKQCFLFCSWILWVKDSERQNGDNWSLLGDIRASVGKMWRKMTHWLWAGSTWRLIHSHICLLGWEDSRVTHECPYMWCHLLSSGKPQRSWTSHMEDQGSKHKPFNEQGDITFSDWASKVVHHHFVIF